MDAILRKLAELDDSQLFDVVAALASDPRPEADDLLSIAMDALESRLGEERFVEVMANI